MGLGFCVLRLTIGLININWFRKNEQRQESRWDNQVAQLAKHFNLVKTVSVYLSHKIQVPLTIGFLKPVIVFPVALVNQLSLAQTEAILLHELAHIKRADYLLNILLSIIQSFLFFNPIIWLMGREINLYREQCCDDLVLDKTSDTLAYAHALLQIETFRNAQLSLALAANDKKYTLLNRIKRITNMEINNPSPQNKLIVLLLALTTIGLSVAWNVPAKKEIKRTIATHFMAVKEALDTTKSNSIFGTAIITENTQNVQPETKTVQEKLAFQAKNNVNKNSDIVGTATVFNVKADTSIKTKNKFKIVLEDSTGNRKEYNSLNDLPAESRKEFLKENGNIHQIQSWENFQFMNDTNKLVLNGKLLSLNGKLLNNPALKEHLENLRKHQEEVLKEYNNRPDWKKHLEEVRKQGEEIRKQFNNPEWKKQMEDIKVQGEEIRKQFNSPEWKKQMEDLQSQSKQMRKQGEEMRKYYQSPEWQKQQEKIQKEVEKSQKEWKKSMDKQPLPVAPTKPNAPEEL